MSRRALRSAGVAFLIVALVGWITAPMVRTGLLFVTNPDRHDPLAPAGLAVRSVRFDATDGVRLDGWLLRRSVAAPTIVLIPGFKDSRTSMLPYARMLSAAGFNVLLYDPRGTGGSTGVFGLGLREVADVRGALAYLKHRSDLQDRHYGLLGVSLGSGDAIVTAAKYRSVSAVVADSPYIDQEEVVHFIDYFHFKSVSVPLAPLGPWTADRILGTPLASFSPLHAISHIAPRHVLLIHSRYDSNPTTPLSATLALKRAGGPTTSVWLAPRGVHAGAFAAQPAAYRIKVLTFFQRYLH